LGEGFGLETERLEDAHCSLVCGTHEQLHCPRAQVMPMRVLYVILDTHRCQFNSRRCCESTGIVSIRGDLPQWVEGTAPRNYFRRILLLRARQKIEQNHVVIGQQPREQPVAITKGVTQAAHMQAVSFAVLAVDKMLRRIVAFGKHNPSLKRVVGVHLNIVQCMQIRRIHKRIKPIFG
jgi:hypothetical protein